MIPLDRFTNIPHHHIYGRPFYFVDNVFNTRGRGKTLYYVLDYAAHVDAYEFLDDLPPGTALIDDNDPEQIVDAATRFIKSINDPEIEIDEYICALLDGYIIAKFKLDCGLIDHRDCFSSYVSPEIIYKNLSKSTDPDTTVKLFRQLKNDDLREGCSHIKDHVDRVVISEDLTLFDIAYLFPDRAIDMIKIAVTVFEQTTE